MVQGHGEAFAGLRRKARSGKQRKAQLQEARSQQREAEGAAEESEAAEVWWKQGLGENDDRVLRARLAIARGRQHCQVRIVIHVVAPPAPALVQERRVEMASERWGARDSTSQPPPSSQASARIPGQARIPLASSPYLC